MKKIILFSLATIVFALGCASLATRHHEPTQAELMTYANDKILILTGPSGKTGVGTGFEIEAPSGKIFTITNRHVCEMAEHGVLAAIDNLYQSAEPVRVVELSFEHDLCIMTGIPGRKGYKMAETPALPQDPIYIIGHPGGRPNAYEDGIVLYRDTMEACDNVPGKKEKCDTRDAIETNVPIEPGNSGSPVFNSHHMVVGIMFAMQNDVPHYGTYVPFEYVNKLLSRY